MFKTGWQSVLASSRAIPHSHHQWGSSCSVSCLFRPSRCVRFISAILVCVVYFGHPGVCGLEIPAQDTNLSARPVPCLSMLPAKWLTLSFTSAIFCTPRMLMAIILPYNECLLGCSYFGAIVRNTNCKIHLQSIVGFFPRD